MKEQPVLEEHYGEKVWTNPIDKIRHDECMCWHCSKLKPAQEDNCEIAESLFGICQRFGIATMITRCKEWQPIE
jgi:hypothetical protein